MTFLLQKFSLSLDEAALAFTLLGREDISNQILLDGYGQKSPLLVEERLITASHSMLAHDLASITSENQILLAPPLKEALIVMTSFRDLVQLTLVQAGGDPHLTDIFFDSNAMFTAHRIDIGVAHKYFHGPVALLDELLMEWIDPPESLPDSFEKTITTRVCSLSLDTVVEAQQADSSEAAVRIIQKRGLDTATAASFALDVRKPQVWGSLLHTGINAETQNIDVNAGGPGFIFFRGDRSSWLIAFTNMDGPTPGILSAGTRSYFLQQIHQLLPA